MSDKKKAISSIGDRLNRVRNKDSSSNDASNRISIPCSQVVPNPHQPRKHFDPDELKDLAESIQRHGLIQPIVVRHIGDKHYELIAGERRLRAHVLIGKPEIEAIVKEADKKASISWSIIENKKRVGLHVFEDADSVVEAVKEFGSQALVAEELLCTPALVSKLCSIATLPASVRDLHAKKLIGDDVELLVSLSRLHADFPEALDGIIHDALSGTEVSRQYIRALLGDLKSTKGESTTTPRKATGEEGRAAHDAGKAQEAAGQGGVVEQSPIIEGGTNLDTTSRSQKIDSPAMPVSTNIAQVHDTANSGLSLTLEVAVPSKRIKRALVDLSTMPESSDTIRVFHNNTILVVPVDAIKILRVVPKP